MTSERDEQLPELITVFRKPEGFVFNAGPCQTLGEEGAIPWQYQKQGIKERKNLLRPPSLPSFGSCPQC